MDMSLGEISPSIFNHVNVFKPMGERQAASPTSSVVQKDAALSLELC